MKKRIERLRKTCEGFQRGLLSQRGTQDMCFVVSAALGGYLNAIGEVNILIEGEVNGSHHFWLCHETGLIIDATADQFTTPHGDTLPAVYVGEKPEWYVEKPERTELKKYWEIATH